MSQGLECHGAWSVTGRNPDLLTTAGRSWPADSTGRLALGGHACEVGRLPVTSVVPLLHSTRMVTLVDSPHHGVQVNVDSAGRGGYRWYAWYAEGDVPSTARSGSGGSFGEPSGSTSITVGRTQAVPLMFVTRSVP
jgi:hypothetical protein